MAEKKKVLRGEAARAARTAKTAGKDTTANKQIKQAIIDIQPKNIVEANTLLRTGSTDTATRDKLTGPRVKQTIQGIKTSDGDVKINATSEEIADFIKNEVNKVGYINKHNEKAEIQKVRTMYGNYGDTQKKAPRGETAREEKYKNQVYPYYGKSFTELTNLRKGVDARLHSGKITQAQADKEKNTIDMWRVRSASKDELAEMRKEAEEYSKYYLGAYNEAQRMGTGYSRGMFSDAVKDDNEGKKKYSKDKLDSYNSLISAIDAQLKEYEVSESYDDNLIHWGKIALDSGASDEYKPTSEGDDYEYNAINRYFKNQAPNKSEIELMGSKNYLYLQEGEIKLFNTLYNHNKKEAKEYLKSLSDVLSRRAANKSMEQAQKFSEEHPLIGGAASVAQNIVMGVPAAIDNAVEGVFGDVDTYDATSRAIRDSQALREGGSEYFSKRYGETGALLYNTGLSMVENLANILLFKGIGGAAGVGAKSVANMVSFNMMASAASNGMISAADRGGNDAQIILSGIANGAAEYIFEKISIDRLFSIKGADGWKNVLKQMGIQSVVEGSEEALTEIANILSDTMIMQGQSENNIKRREYVMNGMSAEEATKKVFMESIAQVALSAAAGAISGGIMGGGATVVSNVSHRSHMNSVGADMLKKPGALNRLIQMGVDNNNTEAVQIATQLYTDGADINNVQTGKMVESVISDVLTKKGDIADIVNVISILEGRNPDYIGSRESIDTARAVMHFVNETATKEDTLLLEKSSGAVTLLTAIEGNTKAWNSVKTAAKADAEYRASKGFEQVQNAEDEMQNEFTSEQVINDVEADEYNDNETQEDLISQTAESEENTPHPSPEVTPSPQGEGFATERYDIPENSEIVNNIVVDEHSKRLKGENPRAYSNIIRMARRLGMNVRFVKDLTDENGKVLDGLITSKGVFINADAKNPSRFVATHEFGHRMKQAAPKEWAKYQEYVINKLKNKMFDSGRTAYDVLYEETKNAYGKDDADYINEEIAVNYAGELFDNEEMLESFIREDKSLALKVRDMWYKILEGLGLFSEKKKAQQMWLRAYTAAANNVKEGKVGEYSGEKSLYLGARAKNADLSMLETAKIMNKRGESREEILKKTGWYIGMDGEWKFEISDKDAKFERGYWQQDEVIKDNLLTWQMGYLEQFFQHEKLYEAYPELRKVFVIFSENMNHDTSGGIAGEKLIMLNSKDNNEQLKDTLIHEIQHMVQLKEGFARGSSIEYWKKKGLGDEKLKKIRGELSELVNSLSEEDKKLYDEFYEFLQESGAKPIEFIPGEKLDAKTEKLLEDLTKFKSLMSEKKWIKKAYEYNKILLNPKGVYEKLYLNTAGEIEARDAALRSDLTESMREKILPAMGDENTIFVEDALGVASETVNAENVQEGKKSIAGTRLSELEEKYGTIKKGAEPRREVSVPKRTEKDNKVRRTARTAAESLSLSETFSDDVLESIVEEKMSYTPKSDREALNYAYSQLEIMGSEWVAQKVNGAISAHSLDKDTVALSEVLLQHYDDEGMRKEAQELIVKFAAEGTRMGQSIQAIGMLKKLSRDYELVYVDKIIENLQEDIIKKSKGRAIPKIEVSEELRQELTNAKSEEERTDALEKIYTEIAEQLPKSWIDRWNEWRYFSMLANAITHVRNVLGNTFFMPMIATKNVAAKIAEGIGTAISGGKMERGKTFFVGKEYRDFAKQDVIDMRAELTGGGKHNPSDIIKDKQKLFPKGLDWLMTGNEKLMEYEDWLFLKHHYKVALRNYLAANKVNLDNVDAATLEKARYRALTEAQRNTYRDLSGFARILNKRSKQNKGLALLVEGLMPFKKTPINVLKRGVSYSPAGLVKALFSDVWKIHKGDITASEWIDSLAQGLTGCGVVALGALLSSLGYIEGASGDEKKKEFEELQGAQNYSLVIGEHSYTLDWLAPFSLPFFVGVEIMELVKRNEKLEPRAVFEAVLNLAEPMLEMSMLSGLTNAITTTQNASDAQKVMEITTGVLKNYIGQGIPTLFGQIARVIDDTRRTVYDDKNSAVPGVIQRAGQTMVRKIPGATKTLQPYVDNWGRKEITDGVFKRALINMLSPGYYSKIETSDMEAELQRLYDEVGNEEEMSLFPSRAVKSFELNNGIEKKLTAEEYSTMQKVQGESAYKMLSDIVGNDVYEKLDDTVRGKLVTNVYKLSRAKAKKTVSDNEWTSGDRWIETALTLVDGEDYSSAEDFLVYHTLKNLDETGAEKEARSFAFENLDDIPSEYWESDLSESAARRYNEFIKDSNIGIEQFILIQDYKGGLKTIDKDTPKEITPKEQMIEYLNGLNLSTDDYRRVWQALDYSLKTCPR